MKLLLSFACLLLSYIGIAQHELLAHKWQYTAVTNTKNEEIKTVSPTDFLVVNNDSSFYYYIQAEHIYATGKTLHRNGNLTLQYDVIPNGSGVDSVIIENNTIVYYLNSDTLKTIHAKALGYDSIAGKITNNTFSVTAKNINDSVAVILNNASSLVKRTYQIETLDLDELVLSENDITFYFNKPIVFQEAVAGFSFWGVFKGLLSIIALLIIGFLISENKQAIKWNLKFLKDLHFNWYLLYLY